MYNISSGLSGGMIVIFLFNSVFSSQVKAALVMNIFSAIAAGISIIMLVTQLILGYRWMDYRYTPWVRIIYGFIFIFSANEHKLLKPD